MDVPHILIGDLRDMDKTDLSLRQLDERPKIRDARHNTFNNTAYFNGQIISSLIILWESLALSAPTLPASSPALGALSYYTLAPFALSRKSPHETRKMKRPVG